MKKNFSTLQIFFVFFCKKIICLKVLIPFIGVRKNTLIYTGIVSLVLGVFGNVHAAESVTARENLEKLIKTNSCKGCDLSGLTLSRMNLAGADLEGADLSSVKFFLSNLAGANLKNCNLKGTTFGGTDLGEADLRGADLRGTSLDGAYLGGTLLDGEFITDKPFEDIGVPDVEKQVYIDNPEKPKKSPETKEVKVGERRDFEEPPPPIVSDQEVVKKAVAEKKSISKKTASVPSAPVAKKVMPVQQAIVELAEEDAKSPAVPAGTKVAESEKTQQNKAPKLETVSPETTVKRAADENKSTAPVKSAVKKEQTPNLTGKKVVDSAVKKLPPTPIAAAVVETPSEVPAIDKKKQDNLSRLLANDKCYGCDLSGLDLSGKNLKNADLEKADLTDCNLEQAILDKANLKGTILRNTNMRKASLKSADLYKADLAGADLTGAEVTGAKFDNAKLTSVIGLAESTDPSTK